MVLNSLIFKTLGWGCLCRKLLAQACVWCLWVAFFFFFFFTDYQHLWLDHSLCGAILGTVEC